MSRNYVIQEWQDAAAFTGEMIKNRQSKGNHFVGNSANTALYADEEPKGKTKPKTSVMDKIDLANRHLNRMELMSAELESDFDNGRITLEEYSRGRRIMDERLKKAWDRVAKQEGWKDEPSQVPEKEDSYGWTAPTTAHKKDSIFLTLPVDNVFYRLYIVVTQAKAALKGFKGK